MDEFLSVVDVNKSNMNSMICVNYANGLAAIHDIGHQDSSKSTIIEAIK